MRAMAGYLGESVVAGYFIGKRRLDLEPDEPTGVKADRDRVTRGESALGSTMTKNSKFADSNLLGVVPKDKPNKILIDGIAEALEKNIKTRCEYGHNVIFADIATHALNERPGFSPLRSSKTHGHLHKV